LSRYRGHQQTGHDVEHNAQSKEHQAQRYQGGHVKVAGRFGKIIGDNAGDSRGWSK
jgi:hypothetical protein